MHGMLLHVHYIMILSVILNNTFAVRQKFLNFFSDLAANEMMI